MRLIGLDIQRMPGFEREGFSYQGLSTGVHVIWGPNGSGKSTTCLALKALLWPRAHQNLHPILLQSEWEHEQKKVILAREGAKSTIPEELKDLLNCCVSHAYFFAIDDLFQEREKDLAKLLSNEMHGGYDLSLLWEKWGISSRFGMNEVSHLASLNREQEKVIWEQDQCAGREEELSQLNEEIEQTKSAEKELQDVECARECLQFKKAIEDISCEESRNKKPSFPLQGVVLLGIGLFLIFFLWILAFLPAVAAFYFFKRHFDAQARFKQAILSLKQKKTYLEGRLGQEMLSLQDHALLDDSSEDLEQRRKDLLSKIKFAESLLQRRMSIEKDAQRILISKRSSEVNQKIQIARSAFEKKQAKAKELLLGRAFLKRIEQQFKEEQQTMILQKASGYFNRFSLGAYSIHTIARDEIQLWDARRDCTIDPRQLSYGFQIQLLLALRLGFLSLSENDSFRLPLFMDEVLCHVDDDRFPRIAEAITEIGKERQVFIFTCQRASFESWKAFNATLIDLEEIQDKQKVARAPVCLERKKIFIRDPLPEEEKTSYALGIGLSGLDRNLKFAGQPAWIVLNSAQEIFQMYKLGIKTIGHLLTLPCDERVREKSEILKKALSLVAIGRSLAVYRHDLERAVEQGVFSETFLDALDECSKRVGGQANALLEALRKKNVKRFLERYIANLEKYFLENGFLDLRQPLSEDELRNQLHAAFSNSSETIEFITYLISLLNLANKSRDMSQSYP